MRSLKTFLSSCTNLTHPTLQHGYSAKSRTLVPAGGFSSYRIERELETTTLFTLISNSPKALWVDDENVRHLVNKVVSAINQHCPSLEALDLRMGYNIDFRYRYVDEQLPKRLILHGAFSIPEESFFAYLKLRQTELQIDDARA